MKKKLLVLVAAATMVLGGGTALANPNGNGNGHGSPYGDNGGINETHPAWYGLCNAYGNNSSQGKGNGRPFQALEEHDWDNSEYDDIADFCSSRTPGNR